DHVVSPDAQGEGTRMESIVARNCSSVIGSCCSAESGMESDAVGCSRFASKVRRGETSHSVVVHDGCRTVVGIASSESLSDSSDDAVVDGQEPSRMLAPASLDASNRLSAEKMVT